MAWHKRFHPDSLFLLVELETDGSGGSVLGSVEDVAVDESC